MADSHVTRPFIEKLRMSGVFAPQGGLNPGKPFGMPNLSAGLMDTNALMSNVLSENQADRDHEIQLARMRQGPALPQIAAVAKEKPMNVVFNPGISEYQRGTLAGRAADRASRESIASGRLGLGREQIDSRENMLDTRGEQMLGQIDARGINTDRAIGLRGANSLEQIDRRGVNTLEAIDRRGVNTDRAIGLRGDIQKDIQSTKGEQGLAQISARAKAAQLLEGSKSDSPGETKTKQDLAVRKLKITNPSLGNLITVGPSGALEISEEATPLERQMITDTILAPGDRQLPSEPYTNSSVNKPKPVTGRKYKPSTIE